MIPIARQIECVRREICRREGVYPGLVARGRMDKAQAAEELATMRAVCLTLMERSGFSREKESARILSPEPWTGDAAKRRAKLSERAFSLTVNRTYAQMYIGMVCLLVALVLFAVAAFGLSTGRINLLAAGLAFLALAALFGKITF